VFSIHCLAPHLKTHQISLAEANFLVRFLHRHHQPVKFHLFSIGCTTDTHLVGAAICMRPVVWQHDDGSLIEVARLATDGTPNACSCLYAACARHARSLGYSRIRTYILDCEPGTSLRAAGWQLVAKTRPGSRSRPSRPRVDKHPLCVKQRWERTL
jgi:hypothetical protein